MALDASKKDQIKNLIETTITNAHLVLRGQHSFINLLITGCDDYYGFHNRERSSSAINAINQSFNSKGFDIQLSNLFFDSDMTPIYEFEFFDALTSHIFYYKTQTGDFREIELIEVRPVAS